VLEKSGFQLEGKARAYLKINGVWADHLLFGLVNDGVGRGG
jgi:ribosomal-protein-alanine N-acetyltransferase